MLQVDYYRPRKQRTWPAIVMGVELMLIIGIAIAVLAGIALDPYVYSDFTRSPQLWTVEHIVHYLALLGLAALWLIIFVWWVRGIFAKSNEIIE
jgi:hypothetical protein